MQLEKATSRANEASLAGWISSNDATLFTTVLVLAIALFLFTQLTKGARENVEITQEKTALAERLALTASELDSSTTLLDHTREALELSRQQEQQLEQQLLEKIDSLAQLNARLEALLKEKGELESERQLLLEARDALIGERSALTARVASLADVRDSLQSANLDLQQRLELIGEQLEAKIAALEGVEAERDRLRKQADELAAIVDGLKQRLEELNIDLAETQQRAASEHAVSQSRIEELESRLAVSDQKAEDYLVKLRRAAELFQGLQAEKRQLETALTEAEQLRQAELLEEARNNRALVGLTGPLERVAVLFDASGSMKQPGSGGSDRWNESLDIAATWLQHLNVEHCVLIVFSSDVRAFPEDGRLADLRGEEGQANRESLLRQLRDISPGGWTNTHDALRTAYQYDIDSILLFSDGVPTTAGSAAFNPALARAIYDLCRQRPGIPVHTIGLGNYFEEDAATFLRTLAHITGGTFRGR